jgi:hypothetical protein
MPHHLAHLVGWLIKGLLLVIAATALSGCDIRSSVSSSMRCAFTDIRADLRSPTALVRGQAAECALGQPPQDKAALVPDLLTYLGDTTDYRSYYSGGGIVGFGEAGTRALSVGQIAMRAVQSAQPVEANIEPIVATLILAANRMSSRSYLGLYGDPGTTAVAMKELLKYDFQRAGLGPGVGKVLSRELPKLRNPVLEPDSNLLLDLQALAKGQVLNPYADTARDTKPSTPP